MGRQRGEADMETGSQPEIREQIERSMLLRTGELGYRHVSVRSVFEGYGGDRQQFDRHFVDKAECFAIAYGNAIERLSQEMLSLIDSEAPCRSRVEGALGRLAAMATSEPALARALFIEVHVAGGPALEKRQRVIERLALAIDAACREPGSGNIPPSMTAEFIVGVVDQAVASSIVREAPGELEAAIPELGLILSDLLRSGR